MSRTLDLAYPQRGMEGCRDGEITQSHAPVYCQRALKSIPFLVRWLNNLRISPTHLTPKNVFKELSNGLVLLAICELLLGTTFDRFERKPIAKRACLNNIESALSVIWKKNVCASHMCTAEDIFAQSTAKVTSCLMEIMEITVLREVRASAPQMIENIDTVLAEYGRSVNKLTRKDPVVSYHALVDDFSSGIRAMLILVAWGKVPAEELVKLKGRPVSREDYIENLTMLVKALQAAQICIFLMPREYLEPPIPCPESLLLQLHALWKSCFDDKELTKKHTQIHALRFSDGINVALPVAPTPESDVGGVSSSVDSRPMDAGGSSARVQQYQRPGPATDNNVSAYSRPKACTLLLLNRTIMKRCWRKCSTWRTRV